MFSKFKQFLNVGDSNVSAFCCCIFSPARRVLQKVLIAAVTFVVIGVVV